MKREEAVKILKTIKMLMCRPDGTPISDGCEAIDMAIEALTAEYEDYEHATLVDIKEPLKVLVVRCKDCDRKLGSTECPCCTKEYHVNEETFYCAWGERKEPLPQYEEWQDEFNKMCDSARPKTFVADEWYRDTFGENDGK